MPLSCHGIQDGLYHMVGSLAGTTRMWDFSLLNLSASGRPGNESKSCKIWEVWNSPLVMSPTFIGSKQVTGQAQAQGHRKQTLPLYRRSRQGAGVGHIGALATRVWLGVRILHPFTSYQLFSQVSKSNPALPIWGPRPCEAEMNHPC